jgi:hypothetical protein
LLSAPIVANPVRELPAEFSIRGTETTMMRILRTSLFILVTLASADSALADPIAVQIASSTLYENTLDTEAATGFGGPNHNILIDDVLVPAARNPLNRPLAITSLTVLVSGTSADDVLSLWSYPFRRTARRASTVPSSTPPRSRSTRSSSR